MNTPTGRAPWGKSMAVWVGLAALAWGVSRWVAQRPADIDPAPATGAARTRTGPPASRSAASEFHRLRQLPGGLDRRLGLDCFFATATHTDLPSLAAAGGLGIDAAARLLREWAERDPAACWAWYIGDGRRLLGYDPSHTIMQAWARRDPAMAMQAIRALPRQNQSLAAGGVLKAWALDTDGSAAAIAPHLEALAFMGSGVGQILPGRDPAAIGIRLLALPDGPGRSTLLHQLASNFFHQDWKAAVAWATQAPTSDQMPLMETFAASILTKPATRQPGKATGTQQADQEKTAWAQQWLADRASDGARFRLGSHYAASLAATDPAAALRWAQDSLGGLSLVNAVAKVIESQAGADPSTAINLVDSLPPGGVRLKATEALAHQWLKQDATAAIDWALAQGPDAIAEGGWMSLGDQWAGAAPDGFKHSLATRSDTVPAAAMRRGIEALVRHDAPTTVNWAATLPPTIRDNALQAAFNRWSIDNPLAAARFVTGSPEIPLPPAAAAQLADRLRKRNPTEAANWALALPHGPARDAAVAALETRP